jgi:hypothetical protein
LLVVKWVDKSVWSSTENLDVQLAEQKADKMAEMSVACLVDRMVVHWVDLMGDMKVESLVGWTADLKAA